MSRAASALEWSWKDIISTSVIVVSVFLVFRLLLRRLLQYHVQNMTRVLTDFGFRYDQRMKARKKMLFHQLDGMKDRLQRPLVIVEIGAGGGTNFCYYPDSTKVICIEPQREFDKYLRDSITKYSGISVKYVVAKAEDMSGIESDSVDAVVSTITLCSVEDVDKCLKEILRILRPDGMFFFLEHVTADYGTWKRYIQTTVRRVYSFVFLGCQLTRATWENIYKAGFSKIDLEKFEAKELLYPTPLSAVMPLISPHICGTATK